MHKSFYSRNSTKYFYLIFNIYTSSKKKQGVVNASQSMAIVQSKKKN